MTFLKNLIIDTHKHAPRLHAIWDSRLDLEQEKDISGKISEIWIKSEVTKYPSKFPSFGKCATVMEDVTSGNIGEGYIETLYYHCHSSVNLQFFQSKRFIKEKKSLQTSWYKPRIQYIHQAPSQAQNSKCVLRSKDEYSVLLPVIFIPSPLLMELQLSPTEKQLALNTFWR